MIAALASFELVVLLHGAAYSGTADSVRVCLRDARTDAPLVAALVTREAGDTVSRPSTERSALVNSARLRSECTWLREGRWVISRAGYRSRVIAIENASAPTPLRFALYPVENVTTLDTLRVVASLEDDATRVGRSVTTIRARDARERGALNTAMLVAQLPLTSTTSARGETGLALRGARREQTAVTLDGMLLNDPSSGVADLSDLPLSALGSATVILGADPLGVGPGATGGVLAVSTASINTLSVQAGAFGGHGFDGGWSGVASNVRWHVAGRRYDARNDFRFVNAAGAAPVEEIRNNNDESRSALGLGATGANWQVEAIASRNERGMVGPANVHAYDADRSMTDRALVQAKLSTGFGEWVLGARGMQLAYRDTAHAELNTSARATAVNAEHQWARSFWRSLWQSRVGVGRDAVTGTGGLRQARARGFVSEALSHTSNAGSWEVGARLDAPERAALLPSFSAAMERSLSSALSVGVRLTQAVRLPTLYDLYFASPQRLSVRPLDPERVVVDAELMVRAARNVPVGRATIEASMVTRDTRDAIVWFPGNFSWAPANVGRERLRGGEIKAALAGPWLDVAAWGAWYRSELESGELHIPTPYTPTLSGGARMALHAAGTTSAAQWHWNGARPFTAGPRNPAFELSAVSLIDLAFTHPWPRRISPRFAMLSTTWSLNNATNVAWQSVRGFPSPGRTWAIALTLQRFTP